MATPALQNVTFDYGHLLINDTSKFPDEELGESIMMNKAKKSLKTFYENLFGMLKEQQGKENQDVDYDKAIDEVILPKPELVLPRSMPIPKEKALTKWEKYRQEKGLLNRKRARMIYSEETQGYVPRWGKGSLKSIQKDMNWAMEEKEHGINPFDKQTQEKQLHKAKQDKRQLKNEINRQKDEKDNKSGKGKGQQGVKKNRKQMKGEKEIKRLDEDKKNLNKRLEQVQKSTASMGHFDKKLKNEKQLNMIKKKKVSADILLNRKNERARDKMILDGILKQK